MLKARLIYLALIIITVITGLVTREFSSIIPFFIGDILWGLAVFLFVRFLFIKKSLQFAVIVSSIYATLTELSQLYQAPWIDEIRPTFFGRVMLGETFLLSDILCYLIGIGLGILVELSLRTLVRSMYPELD
jgi:predicted neutral ceramidase superfamily lipid hydrolase